MKVVYRNLLKSSPNLSFPHLLVAVWVTVTQKMWIIDFTLFPRDSNFQQPAGEYVLAASNWVQLRVCNSSVWRAHTALSLNYKHPHEAFLLQDSTESCVAVQIQLYSYGEIFPSFWFEKTCVNPCLSRLHQLCSYQFTTHHMLQFFIPCLVQSSLCSRGHKPGDLVPVNSGIQKIPECQNC